MLGLVQAVTQYELLTIEAAKSGDPRVAARALLANPLVRQWKHVAALLDDILRENAQLLPQFAAARSTTGG
jgi:6-phospho-beta-glucosidase